MIDELAALLRKDRIGASDAPTALGMNPWMTPYDLWAVKTGRAEGFKGNRYTEAGNYFEPGILKWFADRMEQPLATDVSLLHSDGIRMANLDGFLELGDEPGVVEAKTAGLFGPAVGWGDPDDGEEAVPVHVRIQVHQQFACAEERWPGVDLCHVIAFIGGRGFQHYRIRRNQALYDAVASGVVRFFEEHVMAGLPPDGTPSVDVAQAIQRVEGKVVELSAAQSELVEKWRDARQLRLDCEKDEKDLKGQVIALLGDAEFARCDAGLLTYKLTKTKGYTVEPGSYRSLGLKKAS